MSTCIMPGCDGPVDDFELCNRDLFALIGQCIGKKRLPRHTPRGIERAAGVHKYQCLLCSAWHIGTRLPDQDVRTARTQLMLAELRRAGQGGFITKLAGRMEGVDRTLWKSQHAARHGLHGRHAPN